jgi:cell shape-determining protein MreC
VEKEVIKEVPVPYEVVREVEVIKEVMVEVPVEVVKEVLVEKKTSEDTQRLQETLNKLRQQTIDKDVKIKQLEEEIVSLKSLLQPQKAVYLRGSNLDDNLYK